MLDILAEWRRLRLLPPSRTVIYPLLAQGSIQLSPTILALVLIAPLTQVVIPPTTTTVPQAELQSVWSRLQTEPWLWTAGGWKRPDEVALHPQGLEKAYQSVVLRKYSLSNHPTIYHQPGVQDLLRNVNVTEGLQEEDHLALLQQMGMMPRTITVDDKARAATIGTAAAACNPALFFPARAYPNGPQPTQRCTRSQQKSSALFVDCSRLTMNWWPREIASSPTSTLPRCSSSDGLCPESP